MNPSKLWLIFKFIPVIPATRFFTIKSYLLSWAGVSISKSARVVSSVSIVGNGSLEIGDDTFISHFSFISCSPPGIKIGSNCDIAPKVSIFNGSHEIDMIGEHTAGNGLCLPVVIEDGVWIGANSLILPGVTIGKKAMIGAGSVVTKNIPPYSVAAGNPCRVIKVWDESNNKLIRL